MLAQTEVLDGLAQDLDKLMMRTMALGVPGEIVLAMVHGHAIGRLAAVCGGAEAAAHARQAAAQVEYLSPLDFDADEVVPLAVAMPLGRA